MFFERYSLKKMCEGCFVIELSGVHLWCQQRFGKNSNSMPNFEQVFNSLCKVKRIRFIKQGLLS